MILHQNLHFSQLLLTLISMEALVTSWCYHFQFKTNWIDVFCGHTHTTQISVETLCFLSIFFTLEYLATMDLISFSIDFNFE